MSQRPNFYTPSDRALEFGRQYGDVLAKWGELFAAASAVVSANAALGEMASDASKEFDDFLRQTANAPWNWFNPEMLNRFMASFTPPPPRPRAE